MSFEFCIFTNIWRYHTFDLDEDKLFRDYRKENLTCFVFSNKPRPKLSTPQLFDTIVRSLCPVLSNALIKCSGIPHKPKPESRENYDDDRRIEEIQYLQQVFLLRVEYLAQFHENHYKSFSVYLLLINYVRKAIKTKISLEDMYHFNIPDCMMIEIRKMLLELTYFYLKKKKNLVILFFLKVYNKSDKK